MDKGCKTSIDSLQELDEFINTKNINKPSLLLQCCCGPCSTYVIDYLKNNFNITVLYYNPNIYPIEEYNKRLIELKKVVNESFLLIEGKYDDNKYYDIIKGYENEKEGGMRCFKCYLLRLEETAKIAQQQKFDYFTTTLSVSPYKNSDKLNEIGKELESKYNVNYLYSNFKKHEGYKKSIQMSKELHLYRQEYCGCIYSLQDKKEQNQL